MNAKQCLIFMMSSEETAEQNNSYAKHFRNFVTIQDISILKWKKSNVFYRFCEKTKLVIAYGPEYYAIEITLRYFQFICKIMSIYCEILIMQNNGIFHICSWWFGFSIYIWQYSFPRIWYFYRIWKNEHWKRRNGLSLLSPKISLFRINLIHFLSIVVIKISMKSSLASYCILAFFVIFWLLTYSKT